MDDIKNTSTEQPEIKMETPVEEVKAEKEPKKRSTLYLVLIVTLLVLLLGVLGFFGWWAYSSYLATDTMGETVKQTTVTNSKTAEEKELDKVESEVKGDADLSTDDAQAEADDLNNIDMSGI